MTKLTTVHIERRIGSSHYTRASVIRDGDWLVVRSQDTGNVLANIQPGSWRDYFVTEVGTGDILESGRSQTPAFPALIPVPGRRKTDAE
jgi:hypothetical protein